MDSYRKYVEYVAETKCSVKGCGKLAEYEVILYDFYAHQNKTFYEQDYTCPFLCKPHLDINEKNADGIRKPRGRVYYPYTNKELGQGYSKYNPLEELYPNLFSLGKLENDSKIQIDLNEVNSELIAYLAKHPEYMRHLHHRKFEELIAEIFRNKGYEVTLTPKTRDGGKDIVALYKSPFGHQMFIIECKKYKEENKVGVELVRGLYGVKSAERYNQAILVTTSTFTQDAKEFVKPLRFELQLNDYQDITEWCKNYNSKV